jgi:excinuclease ABC subunit C
MQEAAERQEYEHAAGIRDWLAGIEKIIERQKMDETESDVNRDVFAYAVSGTTGCVAVIRIREGLVIERQHFIVQLSDIEDEGENISSFVRQYYTNQIGVPNELLLPVQLNDAEQLERWLRQLKGTAIQILYPRRGEKVRLLELSKKNAEFLLSEELVRRQQLHGGVHPALEALQKELGLPVLPRRIECFDISNLQGTDTVASMITFVDAKPLKKQYRHYKITTVDGPDDFASMYEVVSRRTARLMQEGQALPDLILIDGGKGQLSAACRALGDNKAEGQPVAALAKRLDELFVPGHADPIMLSKHSPALRLIQRVRDEAHRFAITYHRKLREKRVINSELNAISGIGPKKREALLKKFGSVAKIREATHEELSAVVGEKLASVIVGYFTVI